MTCGWHGSVHLVELCGTDLCFAMKAMDKSVMLNRNKVLKLILHILHTLFLFFSFLADSSRLAYLLLLLATK
jgi:hypothetical protein